MTGVPALFLDRDGVVNIDHGYVCAPERFDLVPGVLALARRAAGAGFRLVVVTNQSGVARGYYGEADVLKLTEHMGALFAAAGAPLTATLYCPFHEDASVPAYARASYWRKPNPGMLLEAARRHGLDLGRSAMIGDQPSDMAAAAAAGVPRRILLTATPVVNGAHTETIKRHCELASLAPPPL